MTPPSPEPASAADPAADPAAAPIEPAAAAPAAPAAESTSGSAAPTAPAPVHPPGFAPPADDPPRGPHYTWQVLAGAIVIGALYGLAMRVVFDFAPFKGQGAQNISGGMMVSFVFLVPMVIGVLTTLLARADRPLSYVFAFFGPWIPIAFFCFGASLLLLEGAICIAIISPLLMLASSVGGVIGALVRTANPQLGRRTLPALLALPLLTGYFEKDYVPEDHWSRVERAVEIRAPAAQVWQLINHPTNISPAEMAGGLAYRIGVPYPIEANTLSEQVGGMRKLVWQKGVRFDENITAIEAGQRICWTYHFAPDSFPHEALDDHVVIGGHYFDLGETCYTLTPGAAGTRLAVSVEYRVSTNFNWYAGAWGKLLVGNTAETILNFYRVRGESRQGVAASTPPAMATPVVTAMPAAATAVPGATAVPDAVATPAATATPPTVTAATAPQAQAIAGR